MAFWSIAARGITECLGEHLKREFPDTHIKSLFSTGRIGIEEYPKKQPPRRPDKEEALEPKELFWPGKLLVSIKKMLTFFFEWVLFGSS